MPNWCENRLTITGSSDELAKWAANNPTLSFANDVPYEGEWDYDWCNANWGVKWDALPCTDYADDTLDTEYEEGDLACDYHFRTPWGQPDMWLRKVSAKYPKLQFSIEYTSTGEFLGWGVYEKGDTIIDGYLEGDEYVEHMIHEEGLEYQLSYWGIDYGIDDMEFAGKLYDTNHDFKYAVLNDHHDDIKDIYAKAKREAKQKPFFENPKLLARLRKTREQ